MQRSRKNILLEICKRHVYPRARRFTVPEPYVPYIPKQWNKRLVLAEAQNHGKKSGEYLAWLKKLNAEDRMLRLYLREGVRAG